LLVILVFDSAQFIVVGIFGVFVYDMMMLTMMMMKKKFEIEIKNVN
jgi:hypothetical protein